MPADLIPWAIDHSVAMARRWGEQRSCLRRLLSDALAKRDAMREDGGSQ